MNTRHHAIVGILTLLLGFSFPGALLAQEMVIDSADPSEAEQGTSLPLNIIGSGFDNSVDKISFKLPCNKKSCPDSGDIIVNSFVVKNDKWIETHISISLEAPTKSFDIAVRSTRGRGGKGTTYRGEGLFTVKLRPNQELLSCGDVVENHLGTCTCQFVWNGDDAFLPALVEDCVTSETLHIKHRFRGELGYDPGNQSTITAVPCGADNGQICSDVGGVVPEHGFKGRSVIANSHHRASIRFLDIRIAKNVPAGCGNGIEAAVSFRLDEETPDPKDPDPLRRNSLLNVDNIGIFSDGEPLCNGIEIIREDGYTQQYSDPENPELARDWKIMAADNLIGTGSYEQAGIVMLGIMPLESINPPAVFGNIIGAAADAENCNDSDPPTGIWFGDLTRDPDNQIDGVVENNEIDMTNDCTDTDTDTGTGVVVVGDPADQQTTVKVNKNTITGAQLGVYVDCDVAEVNFSGNNLNGDGGPIGILSEAQLTTTKGKPNRISGYTTKIDDAGCP
ncbi:hypothetical protein ACFL0N_01535 [Pseudomonadota bacterium]